jgi:hypothetical protein
MSGEKIDIEQMQHDRGWLVLFEANGQMLTSSNRETLRRLERELYIYDLGRMDGGRIEAEKAQAQPTEGYLAAVMREQSEQERTFISQLRSELQAHAAKVQGYERMAERLGLPDAEPKAVFDRLCRIMHEADAAGRFVKEVATSMRATHDAIFGKEEP